ncbi:MAG: hypothetical protein SGJ26_11985, partial [Nitrospirota bacterium]|nr:hypothetical protein [Nitrospirota bacterium]
MYSDKYIYSFHGLRPCIWLRLLRLVTKALSDRLLARIIHERFCYKRRYAAATGSLAAHPFDILHEYASGFHGSECPSRFAS